MKKLVWSYEDTQNLFTYFPINSLFYQLSRSLPFHFLLSLRERNTSARYNSLRLRSGFFMHCARPHVGSVQSHARLCRTRPDPIWIHGHQAHLRHRSQPLHPHRDGPDRLNRRSKKDTALPPHHRPPRKQFPKCPYQKLPDHLHTQWVHQQHPSSSPTHPPTQIQSPRKRLECQQSHRLYHPS